MSPWSDKPLIGPFIVDPKADVVLLSADDERFPVRRISLQANSDVFEGMFDSCSDEASEIDADTGLPIAKLDDAGKDLDLLLRLVVRGQRLPNTSALSIKSTASLLAIAKKYQFDLVAHIASDHLSSVAVFDAPAVLELGLRYRELEVVKSAMVFFHSAKISSLDRDLLESLPAKVVVVRLFILQEKVTAGDLYWMQAARDFNFD